jgi:hypothetical protein
MSLTAAPSQVPAAQVVPATKLRQAPLPSQVPSSPQLETSDFGQVLADRGATPAGTTAQIPGELGVLQALQVSVQALLQQKPSTQKPLVQSPLQAQATPFALRMPLVLLQTTLGVSGDPSAPASVLGLDPWPWHPATSAAAARRTASPAVGRRAWRPPGVK